MMGSHVYLPGKEQDGVSEEAIQQMSPFYTTVDYAMPEPPPAYSQMQAAQWPHHFGSNPVGIGLLQEWQTSRIVNNNEPLMFDWQPEPIQTWDLQRHSQAADPHNAQLFGDLSPPPFRTDATFSSPHYRSDKAFEAADAWQTGWAEDVSSGGDEVLSSVESIPGPMRIDVPESVEVGIASRPPKRRRRASAPTLDLAEYTTPMVDVPMQPSLVDSFVPVQGPEPQHVVLSAATQLHESSTVTATSFNASTPQRVPIPTEKRRRAPTPTIEFPEYMTTTAESTTTSSMTILQSPSPLIPSVRVIADERGCGVKSRSGSQAIFKTQSANAKRGHYASDVWEGHKAAIEKLYIDEGKPLREVIKTMEKQHDFPAT